MLREFISRPFTSNVPKFAKGKEAERLEVIARPGRLFRFESMRLLWSGEAMPLQAARISRKESISS